jgi:hypothetical protein
VIVTLLTGTDETKIRQYRICPILAKRWRRVGSGLAYARRAQFMREFKFADRSVARWFRGLVCQVTTVPFPLSIDKHLCL